MPASACLRILLDLSDDKLAKLDALAPFVSKVADGFLGQRWSHPKRYVILTPYSFMLTDPSAEGVDVAQLEQLAAALKEKLFGAEAAGDVTLLLHEGDEAETLKFATMDHASLKKVTRDPGQGAPFGGRLMKISTEAQDGPMRWQPINFAQAQNLAAGGPGGLMFQGVYFTVGECFVGSGVLATPSSAPREVTIFEGADRLPGEAALAFDEACVVAAADLLTRRGWGGALFVPVSFASVARSATRALYEASFRRLPADKKVQLVAVVYDVPRMPGERAYGDLYRLLEPHFAQTELQVADAGIDIDQIPAGTVTTVSLRLPDAKDMVRAQALRHFIDKKAAFKRRNVRAAVTNVRDREELQACLRQPIAYVSGPAVCAPIRRPVGHVACDVSQLPLIADLV